MKEELVSFETAKLAKSKGFIEMPFDKMDFYNENGYLNQGFPSKEFDNKNEGNGDFYDAPTQALLQRWLREKHKIHIELSYGELNSSWCYLIWSLDGTFDYKQEWFLNSTYELALEEGLIESLKLIKTKE